MYEELRQAFWWEGMKKDTAYFVACCDICNKVKAERKKHCQTSSTFACSTKEMGRCLHGFCHRSTKDSPRQCCSMGCGGHADKGSSLNSHLNHLPSRSTRTVICVQNRQFTWSPHDHHFRPRFSLYLHILVTSPSSFGGPHSSTTPPITLRRMGRLSE